MNKITLILIIIFLTTSTSYGVDKNKIEHNQISTDIIIEQLDDIDLTGIENSLNKISNISDIEYENIDIKQLLTNLVTGKENYSIQSTINYLCKKLFIQLIQNSKILAQIIVLSVLCTLLNNLSSSFESDAVAKLAYIVCYLLIITLAIKGFAIAISIGENTISGMLTFMQALFPILISFVMSTGSITTGALFQPVIYSSISIVSTFMKNFVMPLIFFTAILSIVNNLSSKIHINKLASLLKQLTLLSIGFILTAFSGLMTIKGIMTSTADGLTLRTAKFATERFVPVVGGFISDAFDTVIGCSVLIKNAVGIMGIIILLFIVAMPLIKIFSLILIYKISAAVIEPITDSKLVNCLTEISGSMALVFSVVSSVAIMFFLAVTIIIGTSSLTLILK